MKEVFITEETISRYESYLRENEKAKSTIGKYVQAVRAFGCYLRQAPVTKAGLLAYRETLQEREQAGTVNTKISALNSYLDFAGLPECRIKFLKVQRKPFIDDDRELTKAEYGRLLTAAQGRKNQRLYYIMLTLCSTGLRISELSYITVEAARRGRAEIRLKGKSRTVILPRKLSKKLLHFAKTKGIESGVLFRTKTGRPMDRSNIYHEMKSLCGAAKVEPRKVFPHNLRHLFARCYYEIEKNLAHLADILGHSSVETTRLYVAASIKTHEQTIKKMKLII